MNKRYIISVLAGIMLVPCAAQVASAHVVVKPNQVGIAAFQTFTLGVPNEKDIPTTAVRLLIPDGLTSVSPNVKPGWTITIKKAEGNSAKVTEIDWTGGNIPPGQRDDFLFSAQAPANATTLMWKAYQTYQDGTVVNWDQKPGNESGDDDSAPVGPYSQTKVINDLVTSNSSKTDILATAELLTGPLALLISALALYLGLRK